KQANELRSQAATVMFAARNGIALGLLALADPVKPSAKQALADLKKDGIRIVMLTGDHRRTAEAVAANLGIDQIEAEVLPARKSEVVKTLQAAGHVVAMAGDGIN